MRTTYQQVRHASETALRLFAAARESARRLQRAACHTAEGVAGLARQMPVRAALEMVARSVLNLADCRMRAAPRVESCLVARTILEVHARCPWEVRPRCR